MGGHRWSQWHYIGSDHLDRSCWVRFCLDGFCEGEESVLTDDGPPDHEVRGVYRTPRYE